MRRQLTLKMMGQSWLGGVFHILGIRDTLFTHKTQNYLWVTSENGLVMKSINRFLPHRAIPASTCYYSFYMLDVNITQRHNILVFLSIPLISVVTKPICNSIVQEVNLAGVRGLNLMQQNLPLTLKLFWLRRGS